jgi:excinuclease ABC subunit A
MDNYIQIRGAKEHNLKNINIDIPKNQLVVVTGLSGSGKSSLAFDTIYAEGQRRYVESLSSYARQFLQLQNKPNVESILGLSPAIAIDQKTTSRNPRSTVGTITEIYDYIRLLYARIGVPYSPATGLPIKSQTAAQIVEAILELPMGTKIYLLSPIIRGQKGEHRKDLLQFKKHGYQRTRIDGIIYDLDDLPAMDKNKKHDIEILVDRLIIEENITTRLNESVETALKIGDGLIFVEVLESSGIYHGELLKEGQILVFSEKFSCPISGFQITEIEPRIFSFNSPFGACPQCQGIGVELFFDPELIVPDSSLSLSEGAIAPWRNSQTKYQSQTLESLANHYNISTNQAFKTIPAEIQQKILFGSGEEEITFNYSDGFRKQTLTKPFEGVLPNLEHSLHNNLNWNEEELKSFQRERKCQSCGGHRLKMESLCIKVAECNIGEVSDMTIVNACAWFKNLPTKLSNTHNQIADRILKEINERLGFLNNVGLEYLTLSRESGTLSGGESQRIRLASQIGSGLTGVLYVLDEPSIGLHQRDNDKLITTLKHLRDLGNTVIVVEHDHETMIAADHLIDIGPGAGVHGGMVIAQGTPEEVKNNPASITGQYLKGDKFIPIPDQIRTSPLDKKITLTGAKVNNLKNVTMHLPLGTFTCVTGVSGGGKSSLIIHTLYKAIIKKLDKANVSPGEYETISGIEYIDKVIEIDQSPIGRTPRSNPATYTGAFNVIRDWFVDLPDSKARGYKAGRFSFNVKGGRCETCQGDGVIKIEMHFLPDVYVKCEECDGARYNSSTLEIKYKNHSISDVLNLTVDDALILFANIPAIAEKLKALQDVGLGYIKIGQSATTLSGGEAQRIKLAKELAKRSTGRTLYILDEPTTGLHADDVKKLLKVLHKLVDMGNTALVIEHNLDVIKTADYIVDVGPEGGDKGGKIVASGTPSDIINSKESVTGKYLKQYYKK